MPAKVKSNEPAMARSLSTPAPWTGAASWYSQNVKATPQAATCGRVSPRKTRRRSFLPCDRAVIDAENFFGDASHHAQIMAGENNGLALLAIDAEQQLGHG